MTPDQAKDLADRYLNGLLTQEEFAESLFGNFSDELAEFVANAILREPT